MTQWLIRAVRVVERRERLLVGALVVLVLLAGAFYSLSLGNVLRYPDEQDYYALARYLVTEGRYTFDGQTPTAYRPPGYPLILAALLLVEAPVVLLRWANFVALAGSVWLIAHILRRQLSALAAVIGALLVIAYPVLMYTAGTLYPQTIAGLLLLLIVALLQGDGRKSRAAVLLAGLLLGFLALMVPLFAPFVVLVPGWIWFAGPSGARNALLAFTAALLLILPWSLRNYIAFGAIVPLSSNSGENLLLGNSEHTTPNAGVNVNIARYQRAAQDFNEIERDAYYRAQAVDFVRSNKEQALKLYGLKLLNHFNYRNELWNRAESSAIRDLIMFATYGPLLLIFLARLVLFRRYPFSHFELLLLLLYVSGALVSALFFTRIRFRLPLDLLMILVVGLFLGRLVQLPERGGGA